MKSGVGVRRILLMGLLIICIPLLNAQEISKKRGRVTCYHEDGTRSASGPVYNYNKNGLWKYWDEQGVLHHTATFVNDELHGRYIEYDPNGSVHAFGNYEHGLKEGIWRSYYPSQKILSVNRYKNGRLDGEQITWYESGQIRELIECSSDKLLSRKSWYPGGSVKSIETYKDGLSDGRWITYPDPITSRDTFPSTVDEYSAGLRHGWHYAFLNGNKMEEVHYVAGKPEGTCSKWDEHGHLVSQEDFSCGKRDGKCQYFDCHGVLREISYTDGNQSGPQVDYDRDGDTLSVTWFAQGIRDSIITYHENGVAATRNICTRTSDNAEHCEYTEWNDNGDKLLYGRTIGEIKFGAWYTYYASGAVKSMTVYDNGIISGPYVKWYENGNKMIEYAIIEGNLSSDPEVWTADGNPIAPGTPEYDEIVESAVPGETYSDPTAGRPFIEKFMADVPATHLPWENDNIVPLSVVGAEENTIYQDPEVKPSFPGGDAAMDNFIDDHLVHPAKLRNKTGTVLVCYVVEKDGTLSDVCAVREVNGAPEFTTEALRVVQLFPDMEPATVNGEPVRCKVIVPIEFNSR